MADYFDRHCLRYGIRIKPDNLRPPPVSRLRIPPRMECYNEEDFVPFGLSSSQYYNQSAKLVLIAQTEQMWKARTALNDDHERPSESTLSDEQSIRRWMDASPDGCFISDNTGGSISPTLETGDGTSVSFDGVSNHLFSPNSTKHHNHLHNDASGLTIVLRAKFTEDILAYTGTRTIHANYDGAERGHLFGISATDEIVYGVHNGAAFSSVRHVWSDFVQGVWYTVVVRHTQGGDTEIMIDDFDTPVATDTITTWSTGDAADNFYLCKRVSLGQNPAVDIAGLVHCAQKLSSGEIRAWDQTIRAQTGT